MITFFRTFQVKLGKMPEALALSQEATAYLDKTFGVNVDTYAPAGGDPLRIGLAGEYENLGAVEDLMGKVAEDAGWNKIMVQAADLVIEGSVLDEFWKKV
jgi:hypothetical protein